MSQVLDEAFGAHQTQVISDVTKTQSMVSNLTDVGANMNLLKTGAGVQRKCHAILLPDRQ